MMSGTGFLSVENLVTWCEEYKALIDADKETKSMAA